MSVAVDTRELRVVPPGQEWLPSYPEGWRLERMKAVFREMSEKGKPELPLLAATQRMGVVRKETYGQRTVLAQHGLENLKVVEVDDFVISLRSFEGGIEVAHDRGIISPAYTVLRVRDTAYHGYLRHLLKSRYFLDAIRLSVTGIREGQNINYSKLGCTFVPLPPTDDAKLIVRYLDHAELWITKAIAGKNEVLAKLREAKSAVIGDLVLGDLKADDQGTLTDLGVISSAWSVISLRGLLRPRAERNRPDLPLLSVVRSAGVIVRSLEKADNHNFIPDDLSNYKVVHTGDLVINKMKAWSGSAGIARTDGIVSPAYFVYSLIGETDPDYMNLLFRSPQMRDQFARASRGVRVGQWDLSPQDIKSVLIPVPPLEEQREIARRIGEHTAAIDAAMDAVNAEIALLKEYRTRLISDVVTGKIDVREEAAKLPDIDRAELAAVLAGGTAGPEEVDEGADGDD